MIHRIPKLLSDGQLEAARAFAAGCDYVDGKATNLGTAIKHNEQIDQSTAEAGDVADMIVQALFENARVARAAFPRTVPLPTFSRYRPGMYYGPHLDEALMRTRPNPIRSDLSVTVFLSAPDEYEGGELELWMGNDHALVKMPAGGCVVYPTGLIHQVREVTQGTRYAAVTWIQSFIPDHQQRAIMADYYELMSRLRGKTTEEEKLLMESVRTNLFRRWVDP